MSGTPVVVKLGGTTIVEQQDVLREIVEERRCARSSSSTAAASGSPTGSSAWASQSQWNAGRRVTDEATLEVFLAVISGVINAELTEALLGLGARAVGVRGIDDGMIRGPRAEGLDRVISEPVADAGRAAHAARGRLPAGAHAHGPRSRWPHLQRQRRRRRGRGLSAALGGELVLHDRYRRRP